MMTIYFEACEVVVLRVWLWALKFHTFSTIQLCLIVFGLMVIWAKCNEFGIIGLKIVLFLYTYTNFGSTLINLFVLETWTCLKVSYLDISSASGSEFCIFSIKEKG